MVGSIVGTEPAGNRTVVIRRCGAPAPGSCRSRSGSPGATDRLSPAFPACPHPLRRSRPTRRRRVLRPGAGRRPAPPGPDRAVRGSPTRITADPVGHVRGCSQGAAPARCPAPASSAARRAAISTSPGWGVDEHPGEAGVQREPDHDLAGGGRPAVVVESAELEAAALGHLAGAVGRRVRGRPGPRHRYPTRRAPAPGRTGPTVQDLGGVKAGAVAVLGRVSTAGRRRRALGAPGPPRPLVGRRLRAGSGVQPGQAGCRAS